MCTELENELLAMLTSEGYAPYFHENKPTSHESWMVKWSPHGGKFMPFLEKCEYAVFRIYARENGDGFGLIIARAFDRDLKRQFLPNQFLDITVKSKDDLDFLKRLLEYV